MSVDRAGLIRLGKEVLAREEKGVHALHRLLEEPAYPKAVEALLGCRGRILVSGVGKSGIVAMRIAASLRSTGTPAFYLHPVDAMHGDLGLVGPDDVALLLSKSGESAELLRLLPVFQRMPIPIVAVVTRGGSELARQATVCLDLGPVEEAGPLTVVPTVSVTAFQVVGDLLVTALYTVRGITESELAWLHPEGVVGQTVSLRVRDAMHAGSALPMVREDASLREAIVEIMEKRLGMTTVVDSEGRLTGVLTDGDLRRMIHSHDRIDPFRVVDAMSRHPRTIDPDALIAAAVERMENNRPGPITALVVLDDLGRPEGVLHIHDCLRLRR